MSSTRKLAAILAADVVGFSRLAGAEEERTLARLRALRGDLVDPAIAAHHGRVVKRTGDGVLAEFRSVVDAVRCSIEIQSAMVERNAGVAADRAIQFRVGIHLGDVVEEADGDLMGDGVNIAARLEGIAEPGGICLSEDAYRQVRDKIDDAFADLGEKELKNIARPVRVYSTSPSPPLGGGEGRDEVGDSSACDTTSPSRAVGAGPALSATRRGDDGAPRLSIVVLPFANIGADPEQEYFVDGVTESLTTDLSRISGSFVIARNTAFTYKGKPADVKQIGRELNVRYVLEGSVQRGGIRLRVNVQLIETETGAHLWAERFDKPLADLFDMQDEIVSRLANQLNTELISAEARRADHAVHPDSMDLYFRGMACVNNGWTPAHIDQARRHFEKALSLDSHNLEALVGLGIADAITGATFFDTDRIHRMKAAEARLTRALSEAPQHAVAHMWMGLIQIYTNRAERGIDECERALALDRNLATAHCLIGNAKIFLGRGEEMERHANDALSLSPRDTLAYTWMTVVAAAKLSVRLDEDAAKWARRAIDNNNNAPNAHFYLACALAHLGRLADARNEVAAGLTLNPRFTIKGVRMGAQSEHPLFLARRERLYEGLRKAGVPEE